MFTKRSAVSRTYLHLLILFNCLIICTAATAGPYSYIKSGSYYVKVINGDRNIFKCGRYVTSVVDLRNNEDITMRINHPILSAVAYCPDPEMQYHSVTEIFSNTSDEWFYDPLPVYWSAKALCMDQYGATTPPEKVILFCWEEEMDSGFPK